MHWRDYSVVGSAGSPRAFVDYRIGVELRVLNNRTEDLDDLFPLLAEWTSERRSGYGGSRTSCSDP